MVVFLFGGFGALLRRNPPSDTLEVMAFWGPLLLVVLIAGLFSMILHWLYYAAMESSVRQATLGKSILSLRVTSSEGRRLSFGHATGRFFAKLVSGLIPFAIGYIMAAFTARKQALHDLIAGTVVVKS